MELYIFEGAKGVGKSTAIKELCNQIHVDKVIHEDKTTPNTFDWHKNIFNKYRDKTLVLDRSFIGELVYPYVYGRKPNMEMLDIIVLIKKFHPHIVVGYDSNDGDTIIQRVCRRDGSLSISDATAIHDSNEYFKYLALLIRDMNICDDFNIVDVNESSMANLIFNKEK